MKEPDSGLNHLVRISSPLMSLDVGGRQMGWEMVGGVAARFWVVIAFQSSKLCSTSFIKACAEQMCDCNLCLMTCIAYLLELFSNSNDFQIV